MSDDKNQMGSSGHPGPPNAAAANRRTMVGVAANRAMESTVVGSINVQPRDPVPPSTTAVGTPSPGSTPAFAAPPVPPLDPNAVQAATLHAQPRPKRTTSGTSQPGTS